MARIIDGTSITDVPTLFSTEDIATRNLITPDDPDVVGGQRLVHMGRSWSVPVARFNYSARRIGVVWHEHEANGAQAADSYFTSKLLPSGAWTAIPPSVAVNTTQDQFMPALDADSSGTWVVTFYNRFNDPANVYYQHFFRPFAADGTALQNEAYTYSVQYDPQWQPSDPGFIGDYQDVWEWTFSGTSRWNAASITTLPSDVIVSGIQ